MSNQPRRRGRVAARWALLLCVALLLPQPAVAAAPRQIDAPQQTFVPWSGSSACSGRANPATPLGVQMYGATDRTSPYMPYLLQTGATWVRVLIVWPNAETSPGAYNFGAVERALAAYTDACVNIIATIDFTPDWAALHATAPGTLNRSPIKADNLDDYANFVAALVERYDGDGDADSPSGVIVHQWELYNEPDYGSGPDGGGWGYYGAEYAAMLKAVYPKLRDASPNAKLVFGGIAYDGFVGYGGPFVQSFLEDVLKADGGDYFDVMNFHSYPAFRGDWSTVDGNGLPEKTAAIRAVLAQYELEKPVVVTEAGWHDNGGGAFPSTDDIQSRYVAQFLTQATTLDLDFLIWWMLSDQTSTSYRNGLVTDSDPPVAKPAFTAYVTAAARLGTAQYKGALTTAETQNAKLEAFRYRDSYRRTFYVAWLNPIDTDAVAPLHLDGVRATVYDHYNQPLTVLTDADDGVADGRVTVSVGGSPIYIVMQ